MFQSWQVLLAVDFDDFLEICIHIRPSCSSICEDYFVLQGRPDRGFRRVFVAGELMRFVLRLSVDFAGGKAHLPGEPVRSGNFTNVTLLITCSGLLPSAPAPVLFGISAFCSNGLIWVAENWSSLLVVHCKHGPVAQLDRASVS